MHAAYLGAWARREEGVLREEVQGGQPGAGGPLGEHGAPTQLLDGPSAGHCRVTNLEGQDAHIMGRSARTGLTHGLCFSQ